MKYLDYQGLQEYDALIKQYIQDNIPDSSEIAEALQNAYNPNSTIKIAICTQAEYNALQNPESNVLYIISDETSEVVNVEANPTLAGTESVLGSIKIGGIKYKMPSIEANPTLAGTETTLTGLGINGVNYAMPSGGGGSEVHLYEHRCIFYINTSNYMGAFTCTIITTDNTVFTKKSFQDYCYYNRPQASGCILNKTTNKIVYISNIEGNEPTLYNWQIVGYGITLDITNNTYSNTNTFCVIRNDGSLTDTIRQIL